MHKASAGLMGTIVGGLAGVGAAKVSGVEADAWGDAIGNGSLFLAGGMLPGAVAGILLADPLAKDEVYVLQDKSEEEIEKVLIKLKKRARVEHYP
jgi:hypothetical protein